MRSCFVTTEVQQWIYPDFATTSLEDRLIAGAVFIASKKNYLEYNFHRPKCGIPCVTLDGTLSDWEDVRSRLDKLEEFGLRDWSNSLKTILDQFLKAKRGEVDGICGSKMCDCASGDFCGWINTFCFFNTEGQPHVFYEQQNRNWLSKCIIPSGTVEVNIRIYEDGVKHRAVILAGSMAMQIIDGGSGIRPMSGCVIALRADNLQEWIPTYILNATRVFTISGLQFSPKLVAIRTQKNLTQCERGESEWPNASLVVVNQM